MEFREFILLHDGDDIASLALQRDRLSADVPDWDLALSTLQARRKIRGKLPSWYAVPSLHYPVPLSAEQCSSEETALYKAHILNGWDRYCIPKTSDSVLVPPIASDGPLPLMCRGRHSFRNTTPTPSSSSKMGKNEDKELENCFPSSNLAQNEDAICVADLTGGLGVDAWAFSRVCEKVLYNEMKPELVKAARHNFKELGVENVIVKNSAVIPINGASVGGSSVSQILGDFKPDVIFLDPARRDDVGRKVFMLEDCSPNVQELLPELFEACPRIMLKLSPMADITAVCRQLAGVKEVHVVEADGECKELLLMLEMGYEGTTGLFLYANGTVEKIPDQVGNDGECIVGNDGECIVGNEDVRHCRPRPAISNEVVLFVPGKGLMKTGAFWWPETFGLRQIAASSHMYVGSSRVPELDPFGKFYHIVETAPLSNRSIKEFGRKYPSADVTARNIPMTSDELRKRLGVKPSDGTVHIFGTSASEKGKVLIASVIDK